MPYRLHDDVSFCRVDGRLIFLDIRNDQYFRLPARLERAFVAHMDGDGGSEEDVGSLLRRNILAATSDAEAQAPTPAIEGPSRSAVEQTHSATKIKMAALLEVFAIVLSMQWQLRTRALKTTLDRLVAYRRARASRHFLSSTGEPERRVLDAASVFRRARLYVPVETCCLLDSLAMVKFLAKRELPANIIFGVCGEPFSAHCWVQVMDLVLNDTVGNARSHTPIRII